MKRAFTRLFILAALLLPSGIAWAGAPPVVVTYHQASVPGDKSTSPAIEKTSSVAAERPSHTGLSSLPAAAQGPIAAVLGRDDSRFWVHAAAGGFHADNARHALTADFTRQGSK